MTLVRALVAVPLVLALTATGRAHAESGTPPQAEGSGALDALLSPEVTVRVGALFPMFLIYEIPGPMVGLTLGWPMNEHLQVIGRVEAGAVFFEGAQRYMGTLGAGFRATPWPRWPVSPWLQVGLGTTGYVERIGIVLPERVATAVDVGGLLTADVALGARIAERWELGVGWDHIVWPLPYYEVYTGTESQPYRGNAMAWIGVHL
jgi:hypothetical protein